MFVVVDVESDGGIQGTHSLVCFGAVIVEPGLKRTFYGKVKPISDIYIPNALAVSGFSREEHLTFDDPQIVFLEFQKWLNENCKDSRPVLISDNNGYDAAFVNWYFLTYVGTNPFGWSSRRIGDLFAGATGNMYFKWKKHRITPHSHMPVDDAVANAEALLYLQKTYGLKIY